MKMKKVHKQIVEILKEESPMTLDEISQNLDMSKKKIFKALRKLFEEGIIRIEKVGYYKLSEETEKNN